MTTIATARLQLAPWTDADLPDVAALNADPRVMRHFPSVLSREESDAHVARWAERLARTGLGMLCARERDTGAFVGIIGAQWIPYEADFAPAVELGWRLVPAFWGRGLATEGARATADHVFAVTDLGQVVAIARAANTESIAVMARLGMRYARTFDHPMVPADSPLNPHELHVLDRAGRPQP